MSHVYGTKNSAVVETSTRATSTVSQLWYDWETKAYIYKYEHGRLHCGVCVINCILRPVSAISRFAVLHSTVTFYEYSICYKLKPIFFHYVTSLEHCCSLIWLKLHHPSYFWVALSNHGSNRTRSVLINTRLAKKVSYEPRQAKTCLGTYATSKCSNQPSVRVDWSEPLLLAQIMKGL